MCEPPNVHSVPIRNPERQRFHTFRLTSPSENSFEKNAGLCPETMTNPRSSRSKSEHDECRYLIYILVYFPPAVMTLTLLVID